MPLIALNLDQARSAYAALELRTAAADRQISTLQGTVDALKTTQSTLVDRAALLTQYTVNQSQSNAQLVAQQAGHVSPDLPLDAFIGSLGLAVALSEAAMPDRIVNSVSATLQAYLTFDTGSDGVSKVVGVRLYQPELGQPAALATASFEIAKVPPPPGSPAPRSLYAVLQSKQSLYTNPFWMQFSSGSPPIVPASQVITEIAKVFANIGEWSLPFLIAESAAIGSLETTLAGLAAGTAPAADAAAFAGAAAALMSLVASLNPANRSSYVAGDLYALTAALDATTRVAQSLTV